MARLLFRFHLFFKKEAGKAVFLYLFFKDGECPFCLNMFSCRCQGLAALGKVLMMVPTCSSHGFAAFARDSYAF